MLGGGLVVSIERRADYEYARQLVFGPGVDGRVIEDQEKVNWWEGGYCAVPTVPRHVHPRCVRCKADREIVFGDLPFTIE